MKKLLSFLAIAWFCVVTCAAQNEWQEIVFTQVTAANDFKNDSTFTAENSAFSFTCTDAENKLTVDANTGRFGTAEDFQTYNFRLKTGNGSPSLTFNIPANGILRFAARSAKSADETRKVTIRQNGVELYNRAIKESDSVHVIIGADAVAVYEYHYVNVSAGTATLTVTNGINFYSFAFQAAEAGEDAHYYLAGTMTNWKENMVEMEGAGNVYNTSMVLEANTLHQYKIVKVIGADSTWYGVSVGEGATWEPMTQENSTDWWLSEGMNVGLQTTKRGEYTFRFVANEHKEMSVIYPSEWDEIVFTAITPAGTAFNDSTFRIPYSEFTVTCRNDVGVKFNTRSHTAIFGTQEANQVYNYNLQTGSSLNYLELNIPADGILRMAVRSSNTSDETRTVYVVQDGDTIFARAPKESEKVGSIYPYFTTYVRQGTIQVLDPSVLYYSFAFKEAVIPEASHYYLAGSMNNWKENMVEMEGNGIFYTIAMELDANELYEYKIVKVAGTDTVWYGNPAPATMTSEDCSGWWLVGENNVGLQTTKYGEYTFRFVANDNHEISVIYPAEWDEIIFKAEEAQGSEALNDSLFTLKYSDFSMLLHDPGHRCQIVANTCKFGNASAFTRYAYALELSGSATYITLNIPAHGQLRVAARGGTSTNHNVVLVQNEDTIMNQIVCDADKSEDGYYPYHYAEVEAGVVTLKKPNGAIRVYGLAFKETEDTPSSIEANTTIETATRKVLHNGQILILMPDGNKYTILGQEVR